MSSNEDILGLYPETLVIGSGVTAQITPMPGQIHAVLKWGAGGSLVIIGTTTSTFGSSFMTARQYVLGTTEVFNFSGIRGNMYLLAVGATVTCYICRGRTSGFGT